MPALTVGDDREKSGLQVQIAALDRATDSGVFQLYELVDEEIHSVDEMSHNA